MYVSVSFVLTNSLSISLLAGTEPSLATAGEGDGPTDGIACAVFLNNKKDKTMLTD